MDPLSPYGAMHCDYSNFSMLIRVDSPTPDDSIDSVHFSIPNWNCRTMQLYYNRAMHDDDSVVWCDFCENTNFRKFKNVDFNFSRNWTHTKQNKATKLMNNRVLIYIFKVSHFRYLQDICIWPTMVLTLKNAFFFNF